MGDSDAEATAVATSSRPAVATLDQSQDEWMPVVDGRGRQAAQDREQVLEERTSDVVDERLETRSSDSRRRTLSPSRAALLKSTETGRIGGERRRDTVSPEALATVLKDVEGQLKETEKEEEEEGELETSEAAVPTSEKTFSGSESRPVASEMLSCAVDSDRGNESLWMDENVSADGLTGYLKVASSLLEQEGVERRTTLDPTEAALVVAALQKEAASLSTGAPEVKAEVERDTQSLETDELNIQTPVVSNTSVEGGTKVSTRVEENGEPAAVSTESGRKSMPSLSHDSACRKPLSPVIAVESGALPSPSKPIQATRSLTQSYSKRRTTVDPSDALVVLKEQLGQEGGRRLTIDEHGLLELTRAAGSSSAGKENTAKLSKKLYRKRDSDSIACAGSRNDDFRHVNDEQTMESMDIDSSLHTSAQESFAGTDHQLAPISDLSLLAKSAPSHILESSLFSPPPGDPRTRTPLKGILSARKMRRNSHDAVQTTPNKSVNFGPSQGAEFNYGSPSTSMTPMLAKDASRLFPLEPRVSSEEEPDDDAETSLNSSILDEADSLDEEELRKERTYQAANVKKSGFDLLQSRRNLSQKLTDKNRRRQSLRGYSPLDSHAEARRRRRQTINFTRRTSTSGPAVPTTFAATENPGADSSSSTRNQSFLSANAVTNTGRMPYVDSSASSDTGEDMEITGEYSFMLGRDVDIKEKQSTLATDQVRDEDTAEYSLGHLLAEASMYELAKSVPEPDLHDLPGSLGDLANEAGASSQDGQAGGLLLSLSGQDTALDPIQEKDETVTSSRGQSMMSLDSDESDEEYAASAKSLQVNLKAKFDRVSTDGGTNSQQLVPDEVLPVRLITMKELFSSITLNEEDVLVEMCDAFFGEEGASFNDQVSKNAELACAYDTCSEVVDRHTRDVSSWSGAVAEELSSLLDIKAPAVFSPDILDDTGREAIQKLYAMEVMVARTGWCQLQAQVEKQLTNGLAVSANALANDVKSLKDSVSSDTLKRQDELSAIQEMIDREEQIALLLDAIEEQQGAHAEYVTAVSDLEKECSSLSLEESVLQSRLKVLEGRAAELEPVTLAAASQLEEDVLATEEMLAIQESMCVWKICEATTLHLLLSARYEDVLFDVEICVDVHVGSSSMGEASTSIKTHEFLKHKEQHTYLPYESDVVLVLQRLLLDPHYISRIADESDLGDRNYGYTLSKLQVLEHFINRSYRLLKELRELSTRFDMHYDEEGSTLWIDFLRFPSMASRVGTEGAKFSVGFSLLPVFPYTDYHTAVQVLHGQVSCDAVTKEIELVTRQEPKYFTRVCRRLHESFAR
uniref:Spc7 kinetochore protein domain-containing protein n=1 Tax=Peronospora matthiolae TaxID=2874970 RepID=A0AAV1TME2_9STRA